MKLNKENNRICALRAALLVLCLALTGGCASTGTGSFSDPADPWEGMNRQVFAFNETVDSATLKPIAKAYKSGVPFFVRHRIANFFANLGDVPNALNNLLQGKPGRALNDVLRVAVNTTFGILGLFDVASALGLEKSEEDFGQTLARWGVGAGPYFVVPLLGPSTVRDFPGKVVDYFLSPVTHVNDAGARDVMFAVDTVHMRANLLAKEPVVRELSPDFYSAVKSFYLERRKSLVKDGGGDDTEDLYEGIINPAE